MILMGLCFRLKYFLYFQCEANGVIFYGDTWRHQNGPIHSTDWSIDEFHEIPWNGSTRLNLLRDELEPAMWLTLECLMVSRAINRV